MKKLSSLLIGMLLIFGTFSPAQAGKNNDSDIGKNHRFYDEMMYLVDEDILTGYPDGTYRPKQEVTRAEAAIMIGRMLDYEGGQSTAPFRDVYASMQASGFIAQAAAAGIINGYPDGTFRPDAPVTRGEMAMFMARARNLTVGVPLDFSDVGPNMKAYESIAAILVDFIATGYPDGTFRPDQAITRGEFSAFIARALEVKFKDEVRRPDSYLSNMTKTYSYERADGQTATVSYKFYEPPNGGSAGFAWVLTSAEEEFHFYETETVNYMWSIDPEFEETPSQAFVDLAFPVEEGRSFEVRDYEATYTATYTGVDIPVSTAYKTFEKGLEITLSNGFKLYYVKGHHLVKVVDPEGNLVQQLTNVE